MKRSKRLALLIGAVVFSLTLAMVPIVGQLSPAQAAITWTKRGSVFDLLPKGVGAVCVIKDGDTYKMWHTVGSTDFTISGTEAYIGCANSTEGRNWVSPQEVLTKRGTGFERNGVGSPCVIKDGDTYKMWYTAVKTDGTIGGTTSAIGYVESADGITWTTNRQEITWEEKAGNWEADGVGSPSVIKDGDTYKMWYTGGSTDGSISGTAVAIGYATSTDGKHWDNRQKVFDKGSDGAWDDRGVGVGTVIKVGGTYMMWYTSGDADGTLASLTMAIGYARSTDGITWTNRSQVLTAGSGFDAKGAGAPWVIKDGRTYKMWYTGLADNLDPEIGYATYTVPTAGVGGAPGDTTPPKLSNILASNITKTTADISWETNERSDSQVECWFNGSKLTPLDKTRVLEHLVHLTKLTPDTTYHYKVKSRDRAGNRAVSDEYTFTTLEITAVIPATFATSALTISPTEVDIGESVTISVLVTNIGDLAGTYGVTLKINNVVVATKDVTLAGGASQEVTFITAKDVAGTYTINVAGLADTFVVRAAVPVPLPPVVPPPPTNWWLIGGIIAAVVIIGVIISLVVIRRRA